MKLYIIDNYDSFTYNLYQYVGQLLEKKQHYGQINQFSLHVVRNDAMSVNELRAAQPDRIIISPGPGTPENPAYFGVCSEIIAQLGPSIPLLGICLGLQGIVHTFGGRIVKADVPMHGKTSIISHCGKGLFAQAPKDLEVMRYHSLIADPATLPDCLKITAVVGEGVNPSEASQDRAIMGIAHKQHPIYGIQFHPESFASEAGQDLLESFINLPNFT